MKKSAKILVQGTVQGVFFRQFIKENADKLQLRGFVRNLENGDVEIIVEGDHEDIGRFIEIVKKGPQYSQIRNVSVEEKKWGGEFSDFRVLRI